MIELAEFRVDKNGRTICHVPRLEIAPGERVAILGPNGSGKSTLLRALSGLERDVQGRCQVAAAAQQRVYVHQAPYLFRGTVLFNVMYGLRARGGSRADRRTLALEWLERVGLRDRAGDQAGQLSGGERRRVALARAMILRPALLLLDEPLADLDQDGATDLRRSLDQLPGSTILMASPTPLPAGLASREIELS